MAKGIMGIIACPILEDEIVHSLRTDTEKRNLFVADTGSTGTLTAKLERYGIPFTMIDEWEFTNGFVEFDENALNIVIIMNKLGLHSLPDVLKKTVEDQLKQYQNRFDSIALYYGMCGNAGWDVSKWASRSLNVPVFVFRDVNEEVCDDCIGVAVGGHQRYCEFVKKHPGQLFVTPAIAGSWREFSKEMDMLKGFEIMDIYSLKDMFALFGYKYSVNIDTGIGVRGDELQKGFEKVAGECGLEMIVPPPGSTDMFPTERLYSDAKSALKQP